MPSKVDPMTPVVPEVAVPGVRLLLALMKKVPMALALKIFLRLDGSV